MRNTRLPVVPALAVVGPEMRIPEVLLTQRRQTTPVAALVVLLAAALVVHAVLQVSPSKDILALPLAAVVVVAGQTEQMFRLAASAASGRL